MLGSPLPDEDEGQESHRLRLDRAIEVLERAIYTAIAVFLLFAAVGLLAATVRLFLQFSDPATITVTVVALLDQVLLVFMIAELLHTVRVTLRDRSLAVEPFLVIAIIAAVRRILVITAMAETVQPGPEFEIFWVELLLLMALVLALVVSLVLWRRVHPQGEPPL